MNPLRNTGQTAKKQKVALFGALLCLLILYITSNQGYIVGFRFDDGMYLLGSLSLASGKGYTMPYLAGSPPIISYPPLFSLLLTPIWWYNDHFPGNIPLLLIIPLTLALSALYLILHYYRKVADIPFWPAWSLMLLMGINAVFWQNAHELMSEPLFLCLTTASLIYGWTITQPGQTLGVRKLAKFSLLVSLCFYARTFGLVLIGAVTLWFCFRRQWKNAALFLLFAAALCSPWILWTQAQQTQHPFFKTQTFEHFALYPYIQSYLEHYRLHLTYGEGLGPVLWHGLTQMVGKLGMLLLPMTEMVSAEQQDWATVVVNLLGGGVLLGALLMGLQHIQRRDITLAGLYVFLYLVFCMFWYDVEQYPRFLLMVLPFFLLWMYRGLSQCLGPTARQTVLMGLGGLLLMTHCLYGVAEYYDGGGKTLSKREGGAYEEAFEAIQKITQPGEMVYSQYFTMIPLYTDRQSIAYNDFFDEKAYGSPLAKGRGMALMEFEKLRLSGADYLLTADELTLARLFPTVFIQIYQTRHGELKLYRIDKRQMQP